MTEVSAAAVMDLVAVADWAEEASGEATAVLDSVVVADWAEVAAAAANQLAVAAAVVAAATVPHHIECQSIRSGMCTLMVWTTVYAGTAPAAVCK